jgi:acyl-CoA synthetase (AMP-forming)/AMP-acid ligase II
MIFRAPEPPVIIPEVALTPLLLERAVSRGDKPAFIDGSTGRTLSYRAWARSVGQAAAGLTRHGFRKGDVFAICSPNLPEYGVAFHAASLLGGIVTTINPLNTAAEIRQQLQDANARYLVTTPPIVDKAREAARDCTLRELFVFGETDGTTSFDSLLVDEDPPAVDIDPREDLVALPYSSGTTGFPKGVMLSHYNLVANIVQSACVLDLTADDTMLGVLPFFHIYGLLVILNLGLHVGATILTMPRFELEACLQLLQTYRVTFAPVVPPIVLALARHPAVDQYDVSSLRTLLSGAAPLPHEVARAASERLGCRLAQGYGLTETSPVTHVTRSGAGRIGAGIGPPLPNTEVKVVDLATGADLGPNQRGEICVRGPQVMKGYLNRPDATAAMIAADGWLHTGDVGYADEDSCFFVVDRVKELIKYNGLQVAPAELEAVLLSHPAVADAAVVPFPNEEAGEVPKAFVVLKAGATPAQIMEYVAERVAPYKKVRCLEVIDQIPKSASGKILRRLLVERARARV